MIQNNTIVKYLRIKVIFQFKIRFNNLHFFLSSLFIFRKRSLNQTLLFSIFSDHDQKQNEPNAPKQ